MKNRDAEFGMKRTGKNSCNALKWAAGFVATVALSGVSAAAQNDAECPMTHSYVLPDASVDASAFENISDRMTLCEILEHLGPATRNVGSGLYILEWISKEGPVLRAVSGSFSSKVMWLGLHR